MRLMHMVKVRGSDFRLVGGGEGGHSGGGQRYNQ